MKDFLEIARDRRSIRRYLPDPISDDVVSELLTAAMWAPSAHNRQPWRLAVVREQAAITQLAAAMGERLRQDLARDGLAAEAIEHDAGRSYNRITGAPVVIVLCLTMVDMDHYPDAGRRHNELLMAAQSTAMAGQNLLLAAHARGLGACWMCAPLFCPDVVRETLALPDDWQPQGLITLGRPAETREKTRHPFESRVLYR